MNFGIVSWAAFLDSINPCAISVLLLTIGFLINSDRSRRQIWVVGLTYIFAIYLTYLLIGLGVLRALSFFGASHLLVQIGAGILASVATINILGYLVPNFPIRLTISKSSHPLLAKNIKRATYFSAFILGVLVGLFEFPCTGGPYLFILALLNDQTNFYRGLMYLLYYNAIFVLPLILILVFASSQNVVDKIETWKKRYGKKIDIISAVLMLILATLILWMTY